MVEDRVTDGKRIGQLLASELTGLERGPLRSVAVVDSDPSVEPTDDGAFAYAVEDDGVRVGTVTVTPSTARLAFEAGQRVADTGGDTERTDLTVEERADGTVVVAHTGAAVKGVVDVLSATLSE